ncbi:MAG: NAD+ synthase [Gammaproteobacteria bacterium]|jgi:NAD+ synthase (glutamine-hydrolysing)
MKIGLVQLNTRVGAIDENADKIIAAAQRARDELGCDLLLLPELALCGYPPEDLLLHRGLRDRVEAAFRRLVDEVRGIALYVGYPQYRDGGIFNAAAFIHDGEVLAVHRKLVLPNYSVFDEVRYFTPGTEPTVVDFLGMRLGLVICEDVWEPAPCARTVAAGAQLILVINGSPYHMRQQAAREALLRERARANEVPIVYLNMVGGQDELVFDGGSVAVHATGDIAFRAKRFVEDLYALEVRTDNGHASLLDGNIEPLGSSEESVYNALVVGTRDYVTKNGFPGVVLGLSGGIDSALTLAIAVDALGPERVHAVMMPSRYTSAMSLEDAASQAELMRVRHTLLPIGPIYDAVLATLAELFAGTPADTTEENVQARCRGILLMAISNKFGSMLLTTGNKSEMAVGYATLYGDMAGGFAPLKDCSKTLVYGLARHRNRIAAAIPERVIEREPSAELRPDQKDSDSLPPYDVLDPILEAFIEQDYSVEQITKLGFERDMVLRILRMVKLAEYKRRQAPPGVRISNRAFGRDWRYPITSGY